MLLWNLERADRQFSLYIRKRDGRCMNPLCVSGLHYSAPIGQLECSHYWGRGELIARFDPDNCIALCHQCHVMWENSKQGRYRELMIRLLGTKRYKALKKRVDDYKYKNTPHLTLNGAIKACREYITSHEKPIPIHIDTSKDAG